MLFIVVLCSFVVLSQQCCYPSEWEADEYVMTATVEKGKVIPTVSRSQMKLSWDSPMRRYYYKGASDSNGVTTQFKVLADYISNVMYSVVGSKCTVTKITESFDTARCTPANAKESQAVVGLGQLNIAQYASRDNNGTTFINVASDGCIPISFTAYGNGGTPSTSMYRSGSFENLAFGIKDKSIFNIPPECRGSSLNTIG